MKSQSEKDIEMCGRELTVYGPLDGTKHENITANMGIKNYPLFVPIEDILKQIKANEQRKKSQ